MSISVILHIPNADPVLGEVDELPTSTDYLIRLNNPRHIDGKEINYIQEEVSSVLWPIEKINFIEILPGEEEEEEIISFIRE